MENPLSSQMNIHRFNALRVKYGGCASWAIWSDAGERPKSNIGDLSVFDILRNPTLLEQLKPRIIFVGLNISRGVMTEPLANFHDARPQGTDFKIRHALKGSRFWGGYMTDLFKDLDEKDSNKVKALIDKDTGLVESHVNFLRNEVQDVAGGPNIRATLVAFGDIVYEKLHRHFADEHEVKKIPHYASQKYNNKDRYREAVAKALGFPLAEGTARRLLS